MTTSKLKLHIYGDEGLRKKIGLKGKESIKAKFAPDTMVDTIEAVYKKLLPE